MSYHLTLLIYELLITAVVTVNAFNWVLQTNLYPGRLLGFRAALNRGFCGVGAGFQGLPGMGN